MLDLFILHQEKIDLFPESWVGFKGKGIKKIISLILTSILDNNKTLSYYGLAKEISCNTGMCVNAVWNYFKKDYVPIPIINSLLIIWKKELNKTEKDMILLRKKILKEVKYLKVNNSASKELIALQNLNEKLAYILGAHAADGMLNFHISFSCDNKNKVSSFKKILESNFNTLNFSEIYFDKYKNFYNFGVSLHDKILDSFLNFVTNQDEIIKRIIRIKTEYRWKLVDCYINSINSLNSYLKNCFGMKLRLKKKGNAWQLDTKNKIFVRYLHLFFGFPYGKKSRIVEEPNLITNSDFCLRKAFFRGVLTFDGGVSKNGSVFLQLCSKRLLDSFRYFLLDQSIKMSYGKTKRGSYYITIPVKDSHKLLEYFELNTEKWLKLNSFLYGFKRAVCDEEEARRLIKKFFIINGNTKMNSNECFNIIKELNQFDVFDFIEVTISKNKKRISESIARTNLDLFEKFNIIKRKKIKKKFLRNKGKMKGTYGAIMKSVFTFNPKVNEWRLP